MANLRKLDACKQNVLTKLLASPKIFSLLSGDTSLAAPESLLYQSVYPYLYAPEGFDTQCGRFLCCEVSAPRPLSKTILEINITLLIYAHYSLIPSADGNFIDRLAEEADELLQRSSIGTTRLELTSVVPYSPEKNFFGKMLTYQTTILNG